MKCIHLFIPASPFTKASNILRYCTRKTFFKIFLNEYLFTAYQVVGCYQFLNPHIAKYYCAIQYFFKWMLSLSPEWSTLNSLELKINSIFIAIIRMLGSIRVDQDLDLWNNMSTNLNYTYCICQYVKMFKGHEQIFNWMMTKNYILLSLSSPLNI